MPRKRKAAADFVEETVPAKKTKQGEKEKQNKADLTTKKTKVKLENKAIGKVKVTPTRRKTTGKVTATPKRGKTAGKVKATQKGKTTGKAKSSQKGKGSAIVKAARKEQTTGKINLTANVKSTPSSNGKLKLKDLLKDGKWKDVLVHEFEQPYFKTLEETLQAEYAQEKEIFPPQDLIFNAFHLTPIDKVKVVILGQDPYHDNGQAMGMSFSVPRGIGVPPSLKNIYKELERDPKIPGFKIPDHGCLEDWAKEGILMINATLTVEAHKANSHAKFGWQTFTDSVIKAVSEHCDHVVFILWGGFAHKKEKLINTEKHVAIKTAHPSPLSLNKFKNCNCFSDCDDYLVKFGMKRINWSLC